MNKAHIPVKVRSAKSHKPCESCGFRPVRYKADLPNGKGGKVRFYLCDECIEALKPNKSKSNPQIGRQVA